MTIQEIRDMVAKKIAGQGTNVDAGGGLPAILNGILDAIAAIPTPPGPLVVEADSWPLNESDFDGPVYTVPQALFDQMKTAFMSGRLVLITKQGYGTIIKTFEKNIQELQGGEYVENFRFTSITDGHMGALFEGEVLVRSLSA